MMNKEIEKFSSLSHLWWEKDGPFKVLHKINDLRSRYILNIMKKNNFDNVSVLDVGCGGGILSEKIADYGHNVVGIDLSEQSIIQARSHSKNDNASYFHMSIEKIADKFDVIMVMEVLEHVQDIKSFLEHCINCLKNNGLLFFSTINKTKKSFVFAILIAEYILKMIPKKTHNWENFIKPSTLHKILSDNKIIINDLNGIEFDIIKNIWHISNNIDVNYIGYASFFK